MVYELWRRADICVSLMDVLEEMLSEGKIGEELAVKLMEQVCVYIVLHTASQRH